MTILPTEVQHGTEASDIEIRALVGLRNLKYGKIEAISNFLFRGVNASIFICSISG